MCNCAACKVAAEKQKSCRTNNPRRVLREADGLQSSDNNPRGADTPSENTSADRAARYETSGEQSRPLHGSARSSRVITEITHLRLPTKPCILMLLRLLFASKLQTGLQFLKVKTLSRLHEHVFLIPLRGNLTRFPSSHWLSRVSATCLPLFSVMTTKASAASPQPFLVCAVMRNT